MKVLEPAKDAVKAAVGAAAAAVGLKPKLSREALEEQRYREAVNRDAERRRADRGRALDELMGGNGRWIQRRRGWLK